MTCLSSMQGGTLLARSSDICFDQSGKPQPFDDVGYFTSSINAAYSVLYNNFPSCNLSTSIPISFKDELGVGGGVVSGVNMSVVQPVTGMLNILINGIPACNFGRTTSTNNKNNTTGIHDTPSQFKVLGY
ncbi:PAAR-like domain-containing protein [Legionella spiritensis]|uniref:Uncharacterized protein n=1 Tax=Legionella spiritensis TaxID=452 RepID=A0A0W0ZAC8_LEGSP|nr:PAAR-like domain-containing protein [Legionella spiritensis]KTD65734.1 hypothetical protein Lspi_0446 [Legionella spiritensis]SNV43010.1 Uncharacterised protein [Legionella spiritensis]